MSPYLRSMRELILISLFSLIGFSAQTQCVYEITQNRQINPPGEGCPLGTFALAIAPTGPSYPIFEALYLDGELYFNNIYNYGGNPFMWYQGQVPPGSYQFYLNDSGIAGPENFCFTTSFVMPGTPIEQQITASFSEVQLPENRCSTGSIAMTYALPTPNCLAPITGASLFHDGGVIIGQSTGLTSYLFENVPNTTSYEVKLYSGSTVVKTIGSNVPFLGPCGGGGTGNPEITNATGGCANGSITGLLTPGNCGPTSVSVIDQANGNDINTVSSTSESFSVTNLKLGIYYILYTRESTATVPCPPSDSITVEIMGGSYPEFTGSVSASYSGLPCGVVNAEVIINGQNSCATGAVKLINAETYSVPLTESNVYNFESIPSGNYTLLVDVFFNDGHHTVTSFGQFELIHAAEEEICNTVDDNCDGNIDEGFELHAWVINTDGDNYYLGTDSVMSCSAPDGYVLKTPQLSGNDCDDNNSDIHPGAVEMCNDFDDNCDGVINDGLELFSWVINADGDNYFFGTDSVSACAAPAGYVLKTPQMLPNDCDDNDEDYGAYQLYVLDADGDNHYVIDEGYWLCHAIPGYVLASTPGLTAGDCNDSPSNGGSMVFQPTLFAADHDGDGHYPENETLTTCEPPSGYYPANSLIPGDCNDDPMNDGADFFTPKEFVTNNDGDFYFVEGSSEWSCEPVLGKVLRVSGWEEGDCNDNLESIHAPSIFVLNADGDNYYVAGTNTNPTCEPSPGWVLLTPNLIEGDCDDNDSALGLMGTYVRDRDGDHHFNEIVDTCSIPDGLGWYIYNASFIEDDCNDDPENGGALQNAGHPGTQQGIDNNCNGNIGFTEIIGPSANFNNDNIIDELDLQILMSSWGMMNNSLLDLNQDGFVNAPDIILFNAQFGLPPQ